MGRTFKAEGDSLQKAVEALKIGMARGSLILTVTHGKNTKERVFNHFVAHRLFNARGITKEVALKNISLMFEGI